MSSRLRRQVQCRIDAADVILDGSRPWDPQIHDERVLARVFAQGSLALGESYVGGGWDCDRLDELFYRLLSADVDRRFRSIASRVETIRGRFRNLQRVARVGQVARRHYDLGDDLFRAMLDTRQIYSCGYWRDATSLEEAQEAKLDLVCRKLQLKPGMRVLDVGCGWGGAARFAARRYGVEVVGITVSRDQLEVGRQRCAKLPVEIRLQDYRSIEGCFDRVFSLGMLEHVGYKNYRRFMQVVREHLHPEGLFLLHTIGNLESVRSVDPWIGRYIFPNSMLPSMTQVCQAIEGLFVMEDWHNFGADYDRTLMHWLESFDEAWPALAERYDESFRRMWRFYLQSCAATFRARRNQLWQIVLSPHGVPGGYRAPR